MSADPNACCCGGDAAAGHIVECPAAAVLTARPTILRQVQAVLHDPANGMWGDCNRTCIAMLVGVPRDEVPHQNREVSGEEQDRLVRHWLGARGLGLACFGYNMDLEWVLTAMRTWNPGTPYILAGRSPRGTQHVVVVTPEGDLLDPHPDNTGLVGPDSDGTWWVYFLTAALQPLAREARVHG